MEIYLVIDLVSSGQFWRMVRIVANLNIIIVWFRAMVTVIMCQVLSQITHLGNVN